MTDFDSHGEFQSLTTESAGQSRRTRGRGARGSRSGHLTETYDALPQAATGTPAARSIEGWIIFVRGLHEEAAEEDVHELFAEFGDIKNMHMNLDKRTCFVKGYALIEYKDVKSASLAIQSVNGAEFMENKLDVDWAFLKGPIGSSAEGHRRRSRSRDRDRRGSTKMSSATRS
eukprot:TRINITY_DN14830_c0_g1_i1.p2 TRINITY_DN14830_c0_g1~~TRINITY_DN14830_c0_g1_i1.p2  ORF type:complete len:173 (+),score=48.51 TRINITY_DN14830_c0_g1_i1:102-620(+)